MYNLSEILSTSDFTILLPTDDAIRQYLSSTNSSILVGPDYIMITSTITRTERKKDDAVLICVSI